MELGCIETDDEYKRCGPGGVIITIRINDNDNVVAPDTILRQVPEGRQFGSTKETNGAEFRRNDILVARKTCTNRVPAGRHLTANESAGF